ncbi:MAG: DUF123 domain-containing protein [Candidatus Competibacterales bacterium]
MQNILQERRPAAPGSYVLILTTQASCQLALGRRGPFALDPGIYLYVGSAFGPGGLRGRLRHHLRPVVKPHWHIDYLRRYAQCCAVGYSVGSGLEDRQREHL